MMKGQPKLIMNGKKDNQLPRRRQGDKETRRGGDKENFLLPIP